MWRPDGWENPYFSETFGKEINPQHTALRVIYGGIFEAGADALLKSLKARGLYGEYGEDFIVSNRAKPDDLDWAEAFFKTIDDKGWLIIIPDEEDNIC